MSQATFTFRATGPRTAEWAVSSAQPGLCLALDPSGSHTFGVAGKPRYRLEQPMSPDDAYLVSADPRGDLAGALPLFVHGAEEPLSAWLGRRLDTASQRLLGALPSGRYALVRVARPAMQVEHILAGNEKIAAPRNAREIAYEPPFYAAVFGALPDAPPALGSLLVGVAMLRYAGSSLLDGAWLFDLAGPDAASEIPGEILVVLPIESELVLDALLGFSAKDTAAARAQWTEERGAAFAAWLAQPA